MPEVHQASVSGESFDGQHIELRLLHFYSTSVCHTLPGACRDEVLRLWMMDAPTLSFTYTPLLNTIFSLSLQAMRRNCPGSHFLDFDSSAHRAHYLQVALREHRKGIENLNRDSVDAICLTSALLALDAFAALAERDLKIQTYHAPVEWLQLSHGVRNVFSAARHYIEESQHSRVKDMMNFGAGLIQSSESSVDTGLAAFGYLLDTMDEETRLSEDGEAYKHAVDYIGSVWRTQNRGEHYLSKARRLLFFSIQVHPRFVELLAASEPRALVILAHFFGIATTCSELWWIGCIPYREILAIEHVLEPEWLQHMAWPIDMAKG